MSRLHLNGCLPRPLNLLINEYLLHHHNDLSGLYHAKYSGEAIDRELYRSFSSRLTDRKKRDILHRLLMERIGEFAGEMGPDMVYKYMEYIRTADISSLESVTFSFSECTTQDKINALTVMGVSLDPYRHINIRKVLLDLGIPNSVMNKIPIRATERVLHELPYDVSIGSICRALSSVCKTHEEIQAAKYLTAMYINRQLLESMVTVNLTQTIHDGLQVSPRERVELVTIIFIPSLQPNTGESPGVQYNTQPNTGESPGVQGSSSVQHDTHHSVQGCPDGSLYERGKVYSIQYPNLFVIDDKLREVIQRYLTNDLTLNRIEWMLLREFKLPHHDAIVKMMGSAYSTWLQRGRKHHSQEVKSTGSLHRNGTLAGNIETSSGNRNTSKALSTIYPGMYSCIIPDDIPSIVDIIASNTEFNEPSTDLLRLDIGDILLSRAMNLMGEDKDLESSLLSRYYTLNRERALEALAMSYDEGMLSCTRLKQNIMSQLKAYPDIRAALMSGS